MTTSVNIQKCFRKCTETFTFVIPNLLRYLHQVIIHSTSFTVEFLRLDWSTSQEGMQIFLKFPHYKDPLQKVMLTAISSIAIYNFRLLFLVLRRKYRPITVCLCAFPIDYLKTEKCNTLPHCLYLARNKFCGVAPTSIDARLVPKQCAILASRDFCVLYWRGDFCDEFCVASSKAILLCYKYHY